jgi:hypothetical protein
MASTSAMLLLLMAGGLFVVGFLGGMHLVMAMTRRREERLARERRALNAAWRRLHGRFDIERVSRLEDFPADHRYRGALPTKGAR